MKKRVPHLTCYTRGRVIYQMLHKSALPPVILTDSNGYSA